MTGRFPNMPLERCVRCRCCPRGAWRLFSYSQRNGVGPAAAGAGARLRGVGLSMAGCVCVPFWAGCSDSLLGAVLQGEGCTLIAVPVSAKT